MRLRIVLNALKLVAPSVPFVQPESNEALGKKAGEMIVTFGAGKDVCSMSCESKFTAT